MTASALRSVPNATAPPAPNTAGWTDSFGKPTVYNSWLMPTGENGGAYTQQWAYGTPGFIVTATIKFYESGQAMIAGSTDSHGRLTLNSADPNVQAVDNACGFQQQVIVNGLSMLP